MAPPKPSLLMRLAVCHIVLTAALPLASSTLVRGSAGVRNFSISWRAARSRERVTRNTMASATTVTARTQMATSSTVTGQVSRRRPVIGLLTDELHDRVGERVVVVTGGGVSGVG
ncbi:hypothetical protein MAUB1S_02353 [Mycolicibacterium aubagnense]